MQWCCVVLCCHVVHLDKMIYSSAIWCHHSLPGCELGVVKERLLNGCWVDSFSSTSLLFSSLCSREATHPPSFSELWIAFQSRILSFLAEPEDGALQLQVSSVFILVVISGFFSSSISLLWRFFQRSLSCTGGLDKGKGDSQRWMQRHIKVNYKLSFTTEEY